MRTWGDSFIQSLIREFGEAEGLRLLRRHAAAFPARYRDAFSPDEAVHDLNQERMAVPLAQPRISA